MKLNKYQKFLLLSLPALIITARTWLWIMGFVDYPGDIKMAAGCFFSLIEYMVVGFIVFVP